MTEDTLKQLSINTVFDLMAQSMKDLLEAKNNNDETVLRVMKEQVALLRRFLVAKRSEFRPG
jgi:hypothetical protein